MSNDPFEMSSPETPPKKPGMSTAAKVLIGLAIAFLLVVILCCGGLILVGPKILALVEDTIEEMEESKSEDPAEIAEVTQKIAQIDIPEQLAPKMSMDMKIPLTDQRFMTFVIYQDQQGGSVLQLFAMDQSGTGQSQAQMQNSSDQTFQQQAGQYGDFQPTESYEKQVEIGGKTATFIITKGLSTASQAPRIRVQGAFEGPLGTVILQLDADAETLPEEEIIEMLDSIK